MQEVTLTLRYGSHPAARPMPSDFNNYDVIVWQVYILNVP